MGGRQPTGSLTVRGKDELFWYGNFRYQRQDGSWANKQIPLRDERGERISAGRRGGTRRNRRTAERALGRARARLSLSCGKAGSLAVPEYLRADVLSRRGSIQDATIRGYLDYVTLYRDGLANVEMRDLRPAHVSLWLRHLRDVGKAPNTIRKAFNLLSATCERAVDAGDMATNPCTGKIRREELPSVGSTDPDSLDLEGIRRVNAMLDCARNPRLRVGARLALHCGLRAEEACGLRWRDVDAPGRTLHVRSVIGDRGSALAGDNWYVKTPKSKAGTRDVPMTETVARDLEWWRTLQEAEWHKLADGNDGRITGFDDAFVLGYADGRFFTPHALSMLWHKLAMGTRPRDPSDRRRRLHDGWEEGHEPICGMSGQPLTLHGLRHSYATQLIVSGMDVRAAAGVMGHADPSMTLRVYAAADRDAVREGVAAAAARLEAGAGDGAGNRMRGLPSPPLG